MLAHRLGLVPLRVDPTIFSEKSGGGLAGMPPLRRHWHKAWLHAHAQQLSTAAARLPACPAARSYLLQCAATEEGNEFNVLVFKLKTGCVRRNSKAEGERGVLARACSICACANSVPWHELLVCHCMAWRS